MGGGVNRGSRYTIGKGFGPNAPGHYGVSGMSLNEFVNTRKPKRGPPIILSLNNQKLARREFLNSFYGYRVGGSVHKANTPQSVLARQAAVNVPRVKISFINKLLARARKLIKRKSTSPNRSPRKRSPRT